LPISLINENGKRKTIGKNPSLKGKEWWNFGIMRRI